MNYDGPLYAPWHKVIQGRPNLMTFNLEELKYLQEVLEQATQYTKARGEQVEHPSVSHDKILNKIKEKIHKLTA
tara:strand:- start:1418 stop:1639 length:222 start_codon:yes stop_codon:yes gene_type:complete